MGRARKIPVVIDFFQWLGQPPRDWPEWMKNDIRIRYEISSLQIDTDGGPVRGNKGDYIIKGVEGEVYPCTESVFLKTYEVVA